MTTADPLRARLNGRRAQAARNDKVIIEAARAVFLNNPHASIAHVAERAGVGMSALYRRYPSRDELVRHLAADALDKYIAATETALADDGEPWAAFVNFMRRALEADSHSLTLRLAGTFTPTPELQEAGVRSHELTRQYLDQAKRHGVVRADIEVDDLYLILEMLASVSLGDDERTRQIRVRYLDLLLDSLHHTDAAQLSGPPPNFLEISARWGTHAPM